VLVLTGDLVPDHPAFAPAGVRECCALISQDVEELIVSPTFGQVRGSFESAIVGEANEEVLSFARERGCVRHAIFNTHPALVAGGDQETGWRAAVQQNVEDEWTIDDSAKQYRQAYENESKGSGANLGH
jgi:hypothetical protein